MLGTNFRVKCRCVFCVQHTEITLTVRLRLSKHVNIPQQPGIDSCSLPSTTAHCVPPAYLSCSTGHAASRIQSRHLLPAFPVNRSACGFQVSQSCAFRQLSIAHNRYRYPRRSPICGASTPRRPQVDTAMIWGDILMLTATNLASERLPRNLTGVLSLTLLAAWIGVKIRVQPSSQCFVQMAFVTALVTLR